MGFEAIVSAVSAPRDVPYMRIRFGSPEKRSATYLTTSANCRWAFSFMVRAACAPPPFHKMPIAPVRPWVVLSATNCSKDGPSSLKTFSFKS
jgi:hypothetical protein